MSKRDNMTDGFINETHSKDVESVFGEVISKKLAENNNEKTFLQILVESGQFDLTNKKETV